MSPIEAHVGPMFSGKSSVITTQVNNRIEYGHQTFGKEFLAFKSTIDDRYGEDIIASHDQESIPALKITKSIEILNYLFTNIPENLEDLTYKQLRPEFIDLQAIYLDEAQFFDQDLPFVLELIDIVVKRHPQRQEPIMILFSGLDLDFRGESFPGPIAKLIGISAEVIKHKAFCSVCGKFNATRTQRLINGKPANYDDPIILIGAQENYVARCPEHHQVPGKPYPINLHFTTDNPEASS